MFSVPKTADLNLFGYQSNLIVTFCVGPGAVLLAALQQTGRDIENTTC